MKTNIIFALVCLGIFAFVLISRGRVAPTPEALVGSASDLQAAVAQAQNEGKVVVAIATADWCPPCQVYKRGALADAGVAEWLNEHAVSLVIDVTDRTTRHPDAEQLGVSGIPATFVIRDGEIVAEASGAMRAGELLEMLSSTVTN